MGFVLPILGLAHGVAIARQLPRRTGLQRLAVLLLTVLPMLFGPLLVVGVGALFVTNCDPGWGLVHYLVGPGIGLFLGAGVGQALGLASPRWGALLAAGTWLLLAGLNLQHFYRHPPIFAFNHFVGFFNGAVYDDLIRIDARWAWFRVLSGALALISLLAAFVRAPRRPVAALVVVILLCGASVLPPFNPTSDAIADELGGRHETEHFVIHYPRGGAVETNIAALADDHEFRYHQLAALLGVEPDGKVHSFIYADLDQKKTLMGAGRTYIAKPWAGSIHLNAIDVGASVLKHELAHVFGASIADGWLGIPTEFGLLPNMAIVEGFAVAATWDSGRLTPHQWTAAMRELGIAPKVDALLGATGFLGTHSGQAYTVSGSLLRYLLNTHGLERFQTLYRTGDVEAAYGKTLAEIEREWTTFLSDTEQVPLTENDRQLARDTFDGPSRFHRVCALEVAGWERDAEEATHEGRHDDAITLWEKIVGFDPDPTRRWSLIGALMAAARLDRAAELSELLSADERASAVLRTRARLRTADISWLRGDRDAARDGYAQLRERALDPGTTRRVAICAAASAWPNHALGDVVRNYLVGDDDADTTRAEQRKAAVAALREVAESHPREPLLQYLLARRELIEDHPDAADAALARALTVGLSDTALAYEAHRLRGQIAFDAGRYAPAIEHFEAARAIQPARGYQLEMDDWIARARWQTSRKPHRSVPEPSPAPSGKRSARP